MNISLPESLKAFVEAQMQRRGYNSASEYVRELIRDARDRTAKEAELQELIQFGLEQLQRGEALELDAVGLKKMFNAVKSRARARLSGRRAGSR